MNNSTFNWLFVKTAIYNFSLETYRRTFKKVFNFSIFACNFRNNANEGINRTSVDVRPNSTQWSNFANTNHTIDVAAISQSESFNYLIMWRQQCNYFTNGYDWCGDIRKIPLLWIIVCGYRVLLPNVQIIHINKWFCCYWQPQLIVFLM